MRRLILFTMLAISFTPACSREESKPSAPKPTTSTSAPSQTQATPTPASPQSAPSGTDTKRNRPGEPGFDPTKAVYPPLTPPIPDTPRTLIVRIDRATQHGLHTTIDLSFLAPRNEIGDFSFTLLFKDANSRGLSYQRVLVPAGADTRQITLMGVQADKIASIEGELQDAMTPDGYLLDSLPKRYTLTVEDKR